MNKQKPRQRKPDWLRVRLGDGPRCGRMRYLVREHRLHTVCEEALCPNMGECWEKGRATLMILGDVCSRSCRFCGVAAGKPGVCDRDEPRRAAEAVKQMGLTNVVITSVTRDDLADGGAGVWAETIHAIHGAVPGISVEALIPDFGGSAQSLDVVLNEAPEVLAHNLETVPRLYSTVRPQADYSRSLQVLRHAHAHGRIVKSGIMVGLGETREDVIALMRDTVQTGCDVFTIGQYLQPTTDHLPVAEYLAPAVFERYHDEGLAMGFGVVTSGPLVRSSYYSEDQEAYVREKTQ